MVDLQQPPPVYRLATEHDLAHTVGTPAGDDQPSAAAAPARRSVRWRLVRAVAVVAAVCVGIPVAVAAVWVMRVTVDAGKGADDPESTLISWMYSYADPGAVDADRMVAPEQRPQLDHARTAFLTDMQASGLTGARLQIGSPPNDQPFAQPAIVGDRATWTDWLRVSWPINAGGTQQQTTASLPWRAEARRTGDGWRLWSVQMPPWCGTGGYVERCGPLVDTSPTPDLSGSPSPSPTSTDPVDDLLDNPRQMLRCGPRDPFRSIHDCPPLTPTPTTR